VGGGSVPREEAAGRGARRPRPQPNPENEPGVVGRGSVQRFAPTRSVGARKRRWRSVGARKKTSASGTPAATVPVGGGSVPREEVAGRGARRPHPQANPENESGVVGRGSVRIIAPTRSVGARKRRRRSAGARKKTSASGTLAATLPRPYALRGDGPPGRSAASSSSGKGTSRGFATRGRLGVAGGWGWTRDGLCRAAGGRSLPMLYQPCEEESDTAWVDGREWAILAAPAILAHRRDEQACEQEWPEDVRHWGIYGYGADSPAPPPAFRAGSELHDAPRFWIEPSVAGGTSLPSVRIPRGAETPRPEPPAAARVRRSPGPLGRGRCAQRGSSRTSSRSKRSWAPDSAAMMTRRPAWRTVSRQEKPIGEGAQPAARACASVQS